MGCIYCITNRVNGLMYVGKSSKTHMKRFYDHCKLARNGGRNLLSCAIREFGEHTFECLKLADEDDALKLDFLERKFICELNTNASQGGIGYNMTSGGQGNNGHRWSDVSKRKKLIVCPLSRDELNKMLQLRQPWRSVKSCVCHHPQLSDG